MKTVQFSKKSENPFYGMQNTLTVYQNASKGITPSKSMLELVWKEGNTPDKKGLVVSTLFFIGDVTGRQHNIFEKKVDKGGNSQREIFRNNIIPFLVEKTKDFTVAKKRNLMILISEYTVMDNILAARVQTQKKSTRVLQVINMIDVFGEKAVVDFCNYIITKGSAFQKTCLAKFLTRPRLTKRSKSEKMLKETLEVMKKRASVIEAISKSQNFSIIEKDKYKIYQGFNEWRKKYNSKFESVLFSSGKIQKLDKEEFFQLLESMPSDARFRVRNRVTFSDKYPELKKWYAEWEKFKESKQKEQRELEVAIAVAGDSVSDEMKLKLEKVKKEAKVTTGALSFTKLFNDIVLGKVDELTIQPFLDKVNLPYNTLVFVDSSGSMRSTYWSSASVPFTPIQFAGFMATICLMKNPDPEARQLLGLFDYHCRLFTGISQTTKKSNSLVIGDTFNHPTTPLINDKDTFLSNLGRMQSFLSAKATGGATYISSIPDDIKQWVGTSQINLEIVQNYPVWTLISDGNFNNLGSAASSLNDFMAKCQNYFGFKPYLILIDVAGDTSQPVKQFSGIENVMLVPPNPMNIEMFLTNFSDMDVYDIYTPLMSLFKSDRYKPVQSLFTK